MNQKSKSPTQQLAMEIVNALIEAKLLEEKNREDVARKVMSGNPTSDDWALWVELATALNDEADREDAQN